MVTTRRSYQAVRDSSDNLPQPVRAPQQAPNGGTYANLFIMVGYVGSLFSAVRLGGLVPALGLGAIATIILESVCRRYPSMNASLIRPTNSINAVSDYGNQFFTWLLNWSYVIWEWLGTQFARFTNLYYLFKEFFPWEDICNLSQAIWNWIYSWVVSLLNLLVSPFRMIKGYYDYYMAGTTPLQYGMVSTLIVLGLLVTTGYFYWPTEWTNYLQNSFGRYRGSNWASAIGVGLVGIVLYGLSQSMESIGVVQQQ